MDIQELNIRPDHPNKVEELEKVLSKALLEGNQTAKHYLDLGLAYDEVYSETHQQQDLESAITFYKGGLDNCSSDAECWSELLDNLGTALSLCHKHFGNLSYLDEAITYCSQEISCYPVYHPGRFMCQMKHAFLFQARFRELEEVDDLGRAIVSFGEALELYPIAMPGRSLPLNCLAFALWKRYELLGDMDDLEQAIEYCEQALKSWELPLPGQPTKILSLNSLAIALKSRYLMLRNMADLEKAINCFEQALKLCLPGDSDSIILRELASSLQLRYEQLGEMENLEKAIIYYKQTLELCPPGHPDSFIPMSNLANALWSRYQKLGEMEDLEKAITWNQQALELCASGHPGRPAPLNNLAVALHIRYGQLGEMEDLEMVITCHKQALELHPPGHPGRLADLDNLASALHTRYEKLGEIADMEEAIKCHEKALELSPPGHPDRGKPLNNLANALLTRYRQLGEMEDLEKAITCYEQALELRPPGHPLRSISLNNVATGVMHRYEQLGEIEDLENLITWNKEALESRPPGHPERSSSLNNLASVFHSRYEQSRETEDLEKAFAYYEQALELCADGHPDRPLSLCNLASTLQSRYEQLGEIEDLEKAITWEQQALELCPSGHPLRSSFLNKLAGALYTRYQQLGHQQDLDKTIQYYKQASFEISGLPNRIIGAKSWAMLLHIYGFSSATSAYSIALDLLQQHLALLPSIISQQKVVEKHFHIGLDAAACAIDAGTLEMAVQLLEQGRSILWTKIQGYRQSLGDISQKAPQLAQEVQLISKQLEHNATLGGTDLTLQRALSERWTALLGDIRKLDGFSNYLQATPFEDLQNASAEGPVIMVNISIFRSDAIILVSHSSPVVVPLYDASPQTLKKLVAQLSSATATSNSSKTGKVLQQLWTVIVNPVVEQLSQLGVSEKSHIWWCPTSYLCALPLHAAGPYAKGFKNLPDLYISSYTPTLASLIKARSAMPKPQSMPALLLVSQPDDTIPHVFEETNVINNLQVQITSCSGHDANKQGVVKALSSHPWVHFACHGHLEAQPFDSWFQLHNKEHLTVLDLAKAQLPNAEFAFLSACHSAAGGVHSTPDEAIHLAAALQISGFRSVIGTLWAMVDDDGPSLANEFYKYMFCNPGSVDLKDAAEALNIATKELRRQKVSIDRWINFIHIGA